jgi:hypothetical protein
MWVMVQTSMFLRHHFSVQPDAYVSAYTNVYYEEGNPTKRLSPDCYVVMGVPCHLRDNYKVWQNTGFPIRCKVEDKVHRQRVLLTARKAEYTRSRAENELLKKLFTHGH